MTEAEKIIKLLKLHPLPVEGGLYRQTYKSGEEIPSRCLPQRYTGDRAFGVAIYYLLTSDPDSFSALHKLLTDEIYHFYLGNPVEMLLLLPDGSSKTIVLGQDIFNNQHIQFVVHRGVWQGSHLLEGGRFALLGTTMAPGYDPRDFTGGIRSELIGKYPHESSLIKRLTREETRTYLKPGEGE